MGEKNFYLNFYLQTPNTVQFLLDMMVNTEQVVLYLVKINLTFSTRETPFSDYVYGCVKEYSQTVAS